MLLFRPQLLLLIRKIVPHRLMAERFALPSGPILQPEVITYGTCPLPCGLGRRPIHGVRSDHDFQMLGEFPSLLQPLSWLCWTRNPPLWWTDSSYSGSLMMMHMIHPA